MEDVVRRVRAAAPPDPNLDFWESFNREMHLRLAQSAPAPAPSRFLKMPYYLLGAPALAAVLLWVAIGYLNPERPGLAPRPQMAKQERALEKPQRSMEKMASTPRVAAPAPETTGSVVFVAQNGEEVLPDDDLDTIGGDLDSTLAGMTEKERETFLKKVRQHDKDGSCTRKYSAIFWA